LSADNPLQGISRFARSFTVGLAWRMVVMTAALLGFGYAIATPGLRATELLTGLLFGASIVWVWAYVRRTNVELARFVQALDHGDLSQSFVARRTDGGFDTLGQELDRVMRKLRDERARANEASRYNAALVDEAPLALVVVDHDRVELANKAARRLFGRAGPDGAGGVRIADYAGFGPDFVAALGGADKGLSRIVLDSGSQWAMLLGTRIHRLGRPLRLVAVQPMQGEVNAVEISAQADLVRVLTHEIMNSMTPVTSLAQTAAGLMAAIESDDPDIADARMAVETLARRAQGIMHFVEGYREFIRAPKIRPRRFGAQGWAEELARLFGATEAGAQVAMAVAVRPADLILDADPDLLAQAVLNLLKNGAEAAVGHAAAPRLVLTIARAAGGVSIRVADNGPGISTDHEGDIFLPFFTTKAAGTGVGLSLVRRIVVAHGGTIAIVGGGEGACLEILL
jgi:two-component system nitrogen regulation sensor histidine kinase NtrY